MRGRERSKGYTLVICEKPDAARRVAEALSSGAPETFRVGQVSVLRLEDTVGRRYVICAAMGHLYGISDTVKDRRVYPALDIEWFPLEEIDRRAGKAISSRIRAIQSLSEDAATFVNACDHDVEGETIGYNILKYACHGKEASALRARFSALTKEEIAEAFRDERLCSANGLLVAGRLRHAIDFMWGVNLSRALSEFSRGYGYKTVSIGRVQGPTLRFVVEKESEVRVFVPTPYWTVKGRFRKDGLTFEARYSSQRIVPSMQAAGEVKERCEGQEGFVSLVSSVVARERPPPPFNLADLQREAFRVFAYSPSKTLRIAEKLYLAALVSYPRTGSQQLPKMDYRGIISRISAIPGYSQLAEGVISQGKFEPVQGQERDPAHPAIYPTGEPPRKPLAEDEKKVFDVIVRRFLSCFAEEAVREEISVGVSVRDNVFVLEEERILVPGWTKFELGARAMQTSYVASALQQGDRVSVEAVIVKEHFRTPPDRYSQQTLLERMEMEGIGTKATRADTISTLLGRGYVTGRALIPTELGFSLIDAMRDYCPQIISTRLTRDIESQLGLIEASGDVGDGFFEETLATLVKQIKELREHGEEIGESVRRSAFDTTAVRTVLGRCPVCRDGWLEAVRSPKSGKRFVGCTNYQRGCKASAPLPQRGAIRSLSKPCTSCGWPVVYVTGGRHRWRLCVNDRCPRKVNVYAMRTPRRKHGS